MRVVATLVMVLLVLFALAQYDGVGAQPPLPRARGREIRRQSVADDATRQLHDRCDLLCQRYDQTQDAKVCRRLREECELPCDPEQLFMDVVYVWANESSPSYRRERAKSAHQGEPCRVSSNGMLRYSIRALFMHFPHVRRVFVVTPRGRAPSFLSPRHPRVRIVDARALLAQSEASFNTNAMQFHMHRIATVSDPFVAMNGGALMLKRLNYSSFVDGATNRVRHVVDRAVAADVVGCAGASVRAAAALLKSHFRGTPAALFVGARQPLAVRHAVAQFIASRWQAQLASMASRAFADDTTDPDFDSLHIWTASHMRHADAVALPYECRGALHMHDALHMDELLTALHSPPPCAALTLRYDGNAGAAIALLEAAFPVPAPVERPASMVATGSAPRTIDYACAYSNDQIRIATDAFVVPAALAPFHHTAAMRGELGINKLDRKPDELYALLRPLDVIDGRNDIAAAALRTPRKHLYATQWKAARGAKWCEVAVHIARTAALNRTDFWLLSGQDMGMARSRNAFATRRLAHALGLNYLWAPEFYETNRGSSQEQSQTEFTINAWGLHGNAILSPWQLERASTVRFPNTLEVFNAPLQDLEGEKRLGGRHALFAEARVLLAGHREPVRITVCVMESLVHHKLDSAHGEHVLKLLRDKIAAYGNALVVLGGDFWSGMCERLGMTPAMKDRVPLVHIDDGGVPALGPKWRDDNVCLQRLALLPDEPPHTSPGGFYHVVSKAMETFSDHAFVHVPMDVPAS